MDKKQNINNQISLLLSRANNNKIKNNKREKLVSPSYMIIGFLISMLFIKAISHNLFISTDITDVEQSAKITTSDVRQKLHKKIEVKKKNKDISNIIKEHKPKIIKEDIIFEAENETSSNIFEKYSTAVNLLE